jgi:predicted nucleotidyltransferase
MSIDPAAVEALRLLLDAVGHDRVVIIGASVPTVLIDLRYGLPGGRTTRDVDVVVRAKSWEEYDALKQRLLGAGFRQGSVPHRLEYGTAELDVIPYSRVLAPGDTLEWPGQDRAMSTLGFDEAFESARQEQVGDLLVPMASLPACVLLKFVAYNDRPAERVRDLVDIVHCLSHYAADPDVRRYEIAEAAVDGTPVLYEEAGAYLLGEDVAAVAHLQSLVTVRAVLAMIDDEYARPIQQIVFDERRLAADDRRRRELFRLFRVFSAGLADARQDPVA